MEKSFVPRGKKIQGPHIFFPVKVSSNGNVSYFKYTKKIFNWKF